MASQMVPRLLTSVGTTAVDQHAGRSAAVGATGRSSRSGSPGAGARAGRGNAPGCRGRRRTRRSAPRAPRRRPALCNAPGTAPAPTARRFVERTTAGPRAADDASRTPSPRPLTGTRVLDLSGRSAPTPPSCSATSVPTCSSWPPTGDPLRRTPPHRDGAAAGESSLAFAYYHGGHRSTVLDATDDAALPALQALGARADVVMVSPSPRTPLAGFDEQTRDDHVGVRRRWCARRRSGSPARTDTGGPRHSCRTR